MPRYITPTTSATKAQHTRDFCFTLNSLSSTAEQIEDVGQLGQTVNVKKIRLAAIKYPHEAVGIRYQDVKCMAFSAASYATIPYTPQHCINSPHGDVAFSLTAWVKLPALPVGASHIFWHGTQYGLEVSDMGAVSFTVKTDADNYLKRTSVETIALDTWTQIAVTYNPSAAPVVGDVALYIDSAVCTYTDGSMGVHTATSDSLASSWIAFNGVDTYAADCSFGDLVLYNKAISSYEVTTLWNSGVVKDIGDSPIVISRYVFGDHENDESDALVTDVKGAQDAVVTGTAAITEEAAGGGAANVVAGAADGMFIISIQNIPQLRNNFTHAGSALGQSFSYVGSWKVDFTGGSTAARFEDFPQEEQGATVTLDTQAIVSSLQLRLRFVGSQNVGTGVEVLPPVAWPGNVQLTMQVTYEEV